MLFTYLIKVLYLDSRLIFTHVYSEKQTFVCPVFQYCLFQEMLGVTDKVSADEEWQFSLSVEEKQKQ